MYFIFKLENMIKMKCIKQTTNKTMKVTTVWNRSTTSLENRPEMKNETKQRKTKQNKVKHAHVHHILWLLQRFGLFFQPLAHNVHCGCLFIDCTLWCQTQKIKHKNGKCVCWVCACACDCDCVANVFYSVDLLTSHLCSRKS